MAQAHQPAANRHLCQRALEIAQWKKESEQRHRLRSCLAEVPLQQRPPVAARACKPCPSAHQRLSRPRGLWWMRPHPRPHPHMLLSHCLTQTGWRACSLCHQPQQPQSRALTPQRPCKGLRIVPELSRMCLLSNWAKHQGSGRACSVCHQPLLEQPTLAPLAVWGCRESACADLAGCLAGLQRYIAQLNGSNLSGLCDGSAHHVKLESTAGPPCLQPSCQDAGGEPADSSAAARPNRRNYGSTRAGDASSDAEDIRCKGALRCASCAGTIG